MFVTVAPVVNANINADIITSAQVIVTSALATAIGGTLVVNTVDTGLTSFGVFPGDQVALKMHTSAFYAFATHGNITVGTTVFVFTAITKENPTANLNQTYLDTLPFDPIAGYDYTLPANESDLVTVVSQGDGAFLRNIDVSAEPILGFGPPLNKQLVSFVNFYYDFIYQFDASSYQLLNRLSLPAGSRPYGLAYTYNPETFLTKTWVTLSATNQVKGLNLDTNTFTDTIGVGNTPMGIASYGDVLWVACRGGTVTRINSVYGTISTQSINVGNDPFEITVDKNGNAWVTLPSQNKVARIANVDNTVTYFNVGTRPWGIGATSNGFIYTANYGDNTLTKLNPLNATTVSIPVDSLPYQIFVDNRDNLWLGHFGSSKLFKYKNDIKLFESQTARQFYGIAPDASGKLWTIGMFSNAPNRLFTEDHTPTSFSFEPQSGIGKLTTVTSNTITIAGLNVSTNASIPEAFTGHILKNTVNVGKRTNVNNGDTIALVITTPDEFGAVTTVPLSVGTFTANFVIENITLDVTVDQFFFDTVTQAALNNLFVSNTITVTGIDPAVTLTATLSDGTFVKNNIDLDNQPTTVVLGDTLAIKYTTSNIQNEVKNIDLAIGDVHGTWTIINFGESYFTTNPGYDLGTFLNRPVNTTARSNEVFVMNLVFEPRTITTENVQDQYISVNGQNKGWSTEVVNGDLISVTTKTSTQYNTFKYASIYFGNESFLFTTKTSADIDPDAFSFTPVIDAVPHEPLDSNSFILTGVQPGVFATATTNHPNCHIVVNTIDTGLSEFQVQNGDTISLHFDDLPGPFGINTIYTLTIGNFTGAWSVQTITLPDPIRQFWHEDRSGTIAARIQSDREEKVGSGLAYAQLAREFDYVRNIFNSLLHVVKADVPPMIRSAVLHTADNLAPSLLRAAHRDATYTVGAPLVSVRRDFTSLDKVYALGTYHNITYTTAGARQYLANRVATLTPLGLSKQLINIKTRLGLQSATRLVAQKNATPQTFPRADFKRVHATFFGAGQVKGDIRKEVKYDSVIFSGPMALGVLQMTRLVSASMLHTEVNTPGAVAKFWGELWAYALVDIQQAARFNPNFFVSPGSTPVQQIYDVLVPPARTSEYQMVHTLPITFNVAPWIPNHTISYAYAAPSVQVLRTDQFQYTPFRNKPTVIYQYACAAPFGFAVAQDALDECTAGGFTTCLLHNFSDGSFGWYTNDAPPPPPIEKAWYISGG